jgi:hypothetical protein
MWYDWRPDQSVSSPFIWPGGNQNTTRDFSDFSVGFRGHSANCPVTRRVSGDAEGAERRQGSPSDELSDVGIGARRRRLGCVARAELLVSSGGASASVLLPARCRVQLEKRSGYLAFRVAGVAPRGGSPGRGRHSRARCRSPGAGGSHDRLGWPGGLARACTESRARQSHGRVCGLYLSDASGRRLQSTW